MCEECRNIFIARGLLDKEGNITPKGKKEHVVKEQLLGTETQEHYEEYLKLWRAFNEKWERWAMDERIPEDEEPKFDYGLETWPSEQEEEAQKEQAAKQ